MEAIDFFVYVIYTLLCIIGIAYIYGIYNKLNVVKFPSNFIISHDNVEKPVRALMKMSNIKTHATIKVYFSDVKYIDRGSYMLFLAQVETLKLNNKKVILSGKINNKCLEVILGARYNQYVHWNIKISDMSIKDLHKSNMVNTETIDSIVLKLRKIDVKDYYSPLYDLLVELVGNATEHGIRRKNINWWLHHEIDNDRKCINFFFADMGIGIIESYRRGIEELKNKDSKYIIVKAMNGELGSTTREEGRGRGLPQISNMVRNNIVSDFILITNNVSLHYKDSDYNIKCIPNFKGTMYRWSVSKENYLIWQNILK